MMNNLTRLKSLIKKIPVIGPFARAIWSSVHTQKKFPGSDVYWEKRYAEGGNSGAGSYNVLANYKADVINSFVEKNEINSVIEFGSGDGNQLKLAKYKKYIGIDVSENAINRCKEIFEADKTKKFKHTDDYSGETADLSMSLDVIYHLVEDSVFEIYMQNLFNAAKKFVIIYSSNDEMLNKRFGGYHVKHRKFTDWINKNANDWELMEMIKNKYPYDPKSPDDKSFADFYFYRKRMN